MLFICTKTSGNEQDSLIQSNGDRFFFGLVLMFQVFVNVCEINIKPFRVCAKLLRLRDMRWKLIFISLFLAEFFCICFVVWLKRHCVKLILSQTILHFAFTQWLKDPGPRSEKRTLLCDMACFLLITPLAAISGWLCLRGAQDHLQLKSRLEAVGLIALTIALFTIYILWTLVTNALPKLSSCNRGQTCSWNTCLCTSVKVLAQSECFPLLHLHTRKLVLMSRCPT